MRKRAAGQSKKGSNLFYGLSYAKVILKTWWRARRLAKSRTSATKIGVR